LLASGDPTPDRSFAALVRRPLGDGAWVDHGPGWLAGADALFDELLHTTPWQAHEVPMYGQRLPQPRLSARWVRSPHDPVLPAVIGAMADALSSRYGVTFDSVGANLYRTERDSVPWHGDRVLRTVPVATVAVVSLGATRAFQLRPRGGGPSVTFNPGPGDLVVMGGTCQRTWQHTVPKRAGPIGPRISVTFRHQVVSGGRRQTYAGLS